AVNLATGAVSSTQTWSAGGYELALAPGNYRLIASQNNQVISSRTINMSNVNVEQDFNMTGQWQGGTLGAALPAPHANTPSAAPTVAVMRAMPVQAPVQAAPIPVSASAINWNWTVTNAKRANASNS